MFKRALRVAAVSLVAGGIGFAAVAQTNAPKPAAGADDPVVARVNGSEIRRSDVMRTIANLPPQVQQMPVQMIYPAIIDQIVNGKLVAQAGYAQNLQNDPTAAERLKRAEERIVQELYLSRAVEQRITDDKLQEAYKRYKEENPPQDEVKASHILVESEDQAKQIIDQIINGKLVAEAGYKANVQNDPEVAERLKRSEERIVQELYLTREVQKRITAERLQESYNKFKEENPPQDEVKASHILVESEDVAKSIIADIKKGGDFAKIAGEKSTDKAAAQQGGDLGYFTKDQMVEPFANAAFAMKPGDVSQTPVQTQFGWHVIKVVDRRQSTPPSFEEVQEQLRSQVSEQVIGELVEDLRGKAKVERFQMDGSPMPETPPAGTVTPGSAAPAPAAPAAKP